MRKWWLLGVALLAAGLTVGFWPRTAQTSYYSDLGCGSAFLFNDVPDGDQRNAWETTLGFGDQTREPLWLRVSACQDAVDGALSVAIALLLAGVIVLLVAGVVSALRPSVATTSTEMGKVKLAPRGMSGVPTAAVLLSAGGVGPPQTLPTAAQSPVEEDNGGAPGTPAPGTPAPKLPAVDAARREAYWRSQGWAPPEEIDGPPPGWARKPGS